MKSFLITVLTCLLVSILAPKYLAAKGFETWEPNGKDKSLLNKVHNKAASLEHYEEDFEEDYEVEAYEQEMFEAEFLETVEYLKKRMPASQARSVAHKKLSAKHGKKFDTAIRNSGGKQTKPGTLGANPFYDAAAQFDITITRNTVLIASALTIPLFGSMHFDAKYISVMGSYLPAGVSISAIAVTATGDVTFSLYNGVSTDTITVSCSQIPYVTFINALNYTPMRLSKIRYAISNVTLLQQFNQPFEVYGKSIFGKHSGNGLSLAAVNDPKMLNTGVRDLDNTIDINNETIVAIGIINTAGFSVCLSAFVQGYNRAARA